MADAKDKGFLFGITKLRGEHAAKGKTQRQIANLREAVIVRDKKKCRCCGVSSKKLAVYPLNGNPNTYTEKNLITVCPICKDALSGGAVHGVSKGTMIFLPSLTQAELNWLFFAISKAVKTKGVTASHGLKVYDDLLGLSKVVESTWGNNSSDPNTIKQTLKRLSPKDYANRNKIFYGMRYLPNTDVYDDEIDDIISNDFRDIGLDKIKEIFNQYTDMQQT